MPIFLGDKFSGQNRGQPVFQREYGDLEVYSFRWNVVGSGWSNQKVTMAFSSTNLSQNGLGPTKPPIDASHDLYIWGWDIQLYSRYTGTGTGQTETNTFRLFDGSPIDDTRPDASGVPLLTLDTIFSRSVNDFSVAHSAHDFPSPIKIRRRTDGEATIFFQVERGTAQNIVGLNVELYVMAVPNGTVDA